MYFLKRFVWYWKWINVMMMLFDRYFGGFVLGVFGVGFLWYFGWFIVLCYGGILMGGYWVVIEDVFLFG